MEILADQEGLISLEFEREMLSYMYFRRWFWLDGKSAERLKALRRGCVCKEKAYLCCVDSAARQCVGVKVRIP